MGVMIMAEYLSPGVYVEEFEIGARPIEGVSTSTAGFVGLTQRGRAKGLPELVTSFSEFTRKFGGYLGSMYGNNRFLPYAVDAFFNNGGQRAYVMRILLDGATAAEKQSLGGVTTRLAADTPEVLSGNPTARKQVKLLNLRGIDINSALTFAILDEFGQPVGTPEKINVDSIDPKKQTVSLQDPLTNQYLVKNTRVTVNSYTKGAITPGNSILFRAKDEGSWGKDIRIGVHPDSAAWTSIIGISGTTPATSTMFRLKSTSGFYVGAIVQFEDESAGTAAIKEYKKVTAITNDVVTLDSCFTNNAAVVDLNVPPTKKLSTCEFRLVISYGDVTESYPLLSTNPGTPNYYYKKLHDISNLIDVDDRYPAAGDYSATDPFDQPAGEDGLTIALSTGGSDGNITTTLSTDDYQGVDKGPNESTGIMALANIDDISIIAVPGITSLGVQNVLIDQCEKLKDRVAVLDSPFGKDVAGILEHRGQLSSKYAALYYPWIKTADPLEKINFFIPPSGSIAGIYARTDVERGVHKAPANEKIRGSLDVDFKVGKGEQDILNPKGINCIRTFPGRGQIVWGARTLSDNSLWKYVSVRRLFNYIEESIDEGTQWVVFEPNDEKLWARVRATITQFLTRVWHDGALMGKKPEEAFFVKCDRTTMTQDDIDNGRLVCVIGIAPVKPAEFVIFRIAQWQGGSATTE